MTGGEQVTKQLGGRPADAANKNNPENDHRDLALLPVHFFLQNSALARGVQNRRRYFIHVRTLHSIGVRTVPKRVDR